HLSPTETDGDMLGYDLYSSALADILSEPTMQPPICVGLYAQWGSGKSFLLKKLEVVIYFGGRREGESWNWAWVLSTRLARHIGYLELLLKLMFVNPPELPEQTTKALPVRFLFTDYNRLSSVGGETSLAEMIATLSDACEREFGFLATRLFRVFKTEDTQVGLAFVLNCRTWWQVLDSLLNSQRKRLHNAASKLHKLKSEGFMK
ncbi:hypothetical protein P7K49_029864, partial [Saguinus oedipus]